MPPDAALILAFDTSAAHCAAAVLCGDRVLDARVEDMSRGQAERLMPMLEEMLADQGHVWADLTAIGVGVGPGNFTGIRIAVAAARGLALALQIPAIGVNGFDVVRHGAAGALTALISAPRDQLYAQSQDASGGLQDPALISQEDLSRFSPPFARLEDLAPPVRAERIARIAALRATRPSPRPAPMYLRPADAAPSRDAPPVLLP
ncbi:MAG: tRNA (adenosine(37)-N6)-threonylcarbamoyltransferase complex dimerization subunit type 1 TsaB [Albidovulum sp.]